MSRLERTLRVRVEIDLRETDHLRLVSAALERRLDLADVAREAFLAWLGEHAPEAPEAVEPTP